MYMDIQDALAPEWQENITSAKLYMSNDSGIVTKTYTPISIRGNLQMANNDDIRMIPEEDRAYALWRLLMIEQKQSLGNGDVIQMDFQGTSRTFKVIGVKDNTRCNFSRYILQERIPSEVGL